MYPVSGGSTIKIHGRLNMPTELSNALKIMHLKTLGHLSIDEITPKQVIAVVRKIESRGALDVANRVKQTIRAACRFAIQHGMATKNPANDLDGIVKQRKVQHRASLPREELPLFLKNLDFYSNRGRFLTQQAIKLLVLTFVRSGELRGAMWHEFDLADKVWRDTSRSHENEQRTSRTFISPSSGSTRTNKAAFR